MAITIDEVLQGALDRINTALGGGNQFTFFKERMDAWPPNARTITALCEGAISSSRSPNDELEIVFVVAGSDYTNAKDTAFTIYRTLHLLFDVLAGEANSGYNGFWVLEPPVRFSSPEELLTFSNIYVIRARTWAETRT